MLMLILSLFELYYNSQLNCTNMRKVYGKGLNILGQIDPTYQNYKKFTPIKQLEEHPVADLGCGYLQSYFLLESGQLIKSGHSIDTLSSIRILRMHSSMPALYRFAQRLGKIGLKFGQITGLISGSDSHRLTLLNKNQCINKVKFVKAVFCHAGVHLFDDEMNMYVIGENNFGQRATSSYVMGSSMRKIPYLVPSKSHTKDLPSSEVEKNSQQPKYNKISDAALGFQHTILISNGQAYGCGRAQNFQIQPYAYHYYKDNIVITKIVEPQLVYNRKQVVKAACGYKHTILLTSDNKVYALGMNIHGQCGMKSDFQEVSRITEIPIPLLENQKIIDIKCGSNHTLFLTNQRVYFTGHTQLGQNPFIKFKQNVNFPMIMNLPTNSKPIKIFANFDRSAIITEDGSAYVFGGSDLEKVGGQSGRLQNFAEQGFHFNKESVIGLGFAHTLILV